MNANEREQLKKGLIVKKEEKKEEFPVETKPKYLFNIKGEAIDARSRLDPAHNKPTISRG